MNLSEQDVRALVREAIERHLGRPGGRPERVTGEPVHPSHALLPVASGSAVDEGMCLIEPVVRCTHCGFCKSYGH
jgi:hypothetical protein